MSEAGSGVYEATARALLLSGRCQIVYEAYYDSSLELPRARLLYEVLR